MTKQDNIIRKLLKSKGLDKTLKLFGGHDKPIANFLKNNNTFIYEFIDNLNVEPITRFGSIYKVLSNDDGIYFVLQSKDNFHIPSKLWIYFKLLEYTDEEIEDELLPILNNRFETNLSEINLLE
jgi:hypothetical protein